MKSLAHRKNYSISAVPRGRNIVIDLLSVVSRRAKPGHLLCDVDMTWVSSLRENLLDSGSKVTVTAVLLKAIGIAQRNNPQSRTELLPWRRTVTYKDIVAGFTVERFIKEKASVFFGEILSPDKKSLSELANELKFHAQSPISEIAALKQQYLFSGAPSLVRTLILKIATTFPFFRLRFQKATFGLTSLGKFGISSVLSPCICTSTFTVGTQEDRPVVRAGKLVIRPIMTVSLSFDQRILDPSIAAQLLNEVKELLEGRLGAHIDNARIPLLQGCN